MHPPAQGNQVEETPFAWWTNPAPTREDLWRNLLNKEAQAAAQHSNEFMNREAFNHSENRFDVPERPKGPGPREDVQHDFQYFRHCNIPRSEHPSNSQQQSRFSQYWRTSSQLTCSQPPSTAEAEAYRRAVVKQQLERYERLWRKLSSTGDYSITVDQVPWPLFELPFPLDPERFTKSAVEEFVIHTYRLEGAKLSFQEMVKFRRSRVKEELLRWHPDKFRAKVLSKVIPSQREIVSQCAEAVAKVLGTLL